MTTQPIESWNVARANLFTPIRYLLVILIVIYHGYVMCAVPAKCLIDGVACVDCFFIISGYWATYSYVRRGNIREFYCRRAIRIFPEYWAVVLFGLLIGLVCTTLPLTDFLTSSQTWKYLAANLSTLNALCPELPGVFFDNVFTAVNGSLWFVKIVLAFYLILPLISRRGNAVADYKILLLIYLLAFLYCDVIQRLTSNGNSWLLHQLPGKMMYFVAGMSALKFFPWLIRHKMIAFAAGILFFVANELRDSLLPDNHVLLIIANYLRPVAITAVLFAVAYSSEAIAKRLHWLRDYSYGIFLFHFPLFQLILNFGLIEFYEEYRQGLIETSFYVYTQPVNLSLWFYTAVVIVASLLLSIAFNAIWRRITNKMQQRGKE